VRGTKLLQTMEGFVDGRCYSNVMRTKVLNPNSGRSILFREFQCNGGLQAISELSVQGDKRTRTEMKSAEDYTHV
jgi:hypothetical protein